MKTVLSGTLLRSAVGLVTVLLWAAGCASVTKTETRRAFDALPADATLSAYVYHERLFLRFRENGEQKVFEASWAARGVEKSGDDRFRTSQLRLLEKVPEDVEQVRASAREARVISLQQFREFLPEVANRLAPPGAGEGAFLSISDREFVVYRDSEGGARDRPGGSGAAGNADRAPDQSDGVLPRPDRRRRRLPAQGGRSADG